MAGKYLIFIGEQMNILGIFDTLDTEVSVLLTFSGHATLFIALSVDSFELFFQ